MDALDQLLGLSGDPVPAMDGGFNPRIERLLRLLPLIVSLEVGVLLSLAGLALLALMIAPNRHRAAVDRCAAAPVVSFLVGMPVLLCLAFLLRVLLRHGIMPGRGLCCVLLFTAVGCGVSVCARALGERVAGERGPLAQTAIGLAALLLPLACPLALPLLLVVAPLGLGAWLTARK